MYVCMLFFLVASNLLAAGEFTVAVQGYRMTVSDPDCISSFANDESSESDYNDRDNDDSYREDQDISCTIFIENVTEDMHGFLEIVIESKSGGTVVAFEPDDRLGGVLITFAEPEGMMHIFKDCYFATIMGFVH